MLDIIFCTFSGEKCTVKYTYSGSKGGEIGTEPNGLGTKYLEENITFIHFLALAESAVMLIEVKEEIEQNHNTRDLLDKASR